MQVTETKTDGLKRQYRVTVEAQEIESKIAQRLETLRSTVRMKGFRPGRVPKDLLLRLYGDSLRQEVRGETIEESVRNALESQSVRPAMQPSIDNLTGGESGQDLAFDLDVEIFPSIELPDFSEIALDRPVATVDDAPVDEVLQRLAQQHRTFAPRAEDEQAQDGDRLTIDIEVKHGEERIDQISGEDIQVALGSSYVLPGLSEALTGVRAGETRIFDLTLPEAYPLEKLRGESVAVRTEIKEVAAPSDPSVDDELARNMGFDSLDALRDAVRKQVEHDFQTASRARAKRNLLDQLDTKVSFELPPGMVEQEFRGLWQQAHPEDARRELEALYQQDHEHGHAHDHDHDHSHAHDHDQAPADTAAASTETDSPEREKERDELRRIAERRGRLGLLLAEVGRTNEINVTQEEINRAVVEQARSMPGREQVVLDFYRKRPEAVNQLVAPILEVKVVDYILELAKVSEREVSREELFRDPDDETPVEDTAEKPAKKSSAGKKAKRGGAEA
jgi:trigger factor